MPPIDGQVMVPGGAVSMGVPVAPASGTIPLSTLVEYSIQSTYHELTVLSELLPRKTDMERKIEIVQFASRTRQLFVRLLGLVKWANSASKVDKCAMISNFLDQQAMLFVDTADMLAKMARSTLVNARLPSFSIPCAIDVLTTGTYPRLPICIKEKIVPPDPITHQEKYQTLFRLNQIIEHRLVTTDLPKHMRRPKIQKGRVIFRVQHEFEVTLTLMGDGANVPWRLLDIEILVEDPDTGGGKSLVHSLQVTYIHQLVQARLMDNDKPLDDLYNVLHSFCQSLQLEVLYSQSQRLIQQRLGDHIRVEEYIHSKKLVLSYWRNQLRRDSKPSAHIFKLSVFVDEHSPAKPLQISHFPQIQGSESIKVAQTIRSDYLSLEKLLVHTIQIRSLAKLKDLEREFRLIHVVAGPCETRDLPTVLYVPVLHPCMTTEKLAISVDMHTGHFLASLCSKEIPLTNDIEQSLNADRRELRRHLSKLRLWLGLQRCFKSAQQLSTSVHESLPFINISGHPVLEKLSRSHLFIRLNKLSHYYLVVDVLESRRRQLLYNYYLLQAAACSQTSDLQQQDGGSGGETPSSSSSSQQQQQAGSSNVEELRAVYLRAGHVTPLDTFSTTHGLAARIFDVEEEDSVSLHRKRKLLLGDMACEPPQKKQRGCADFVADLVHILAMCEDHLPIMELSQELQRREIDHSAAVLLDNGAGLGLTLLSAPAVLTVTESSRDDLARCLLSLTFRIQRKNPPAWHVEGLLTGCPMRGSRQQQQEGSVQRVHWIYDMGESGKNTVQRLVDDWTAVATLYDAVLTFAEEYKGDRYLQSELEIRSYTYKELVLAYGPNKCYTCTVSYRSSEGQFQLVVGTVGACNVANCHLLMLTQLQRELNHTRSLAKLAQYLADTWSLLQSLGKLTATAMIGMTQQAAKPITSFTLLPQSASHIRVYFRHMCCLDIQCRSERTVAVRDGAYSKFEASKVVDGCSPISGLKAFLNLFVDDTVTARRRSTVEDDNPPSPLGMDMDTFMATQHSTASPSAHSHHNPRSVGGKYPLTPTSNPCTPASPSTSRGSNQPVITPSPSNMMAPSPSNPALHVQSPSSFMTAPSPQGIHMPSPANPFISPQVGASSVLSPPPARMLPQRSWAASVATVLSEEALSRLTTPQPAAAGAGSNVSLSPLEKFLSCAATRKCILRAAQQEETLSLVPSNEAGVVVVKAESLQLRFGIHPQTLQSLSMKAAPDSAQPASAAAAAAGGWEQDELTVLEKFFEMRVAVYPFRTNTVASFMKILSVPTRVLKDTLQIMRLELFPEKNMRWSIQVCLTAPHTSYSMVNAGVNMVHMVKNKFLLGFQLTRLPMVQANGPSGQQQQQQQQAQSELSVFVPVLYDMHTNKTTTSYNNNTRQQHPAQNSSINIITTMFTRFNDYNSKPNECSLYPAVRELLSNLQLPG